MEYKIQSQFQFKLILMIVWFPFWILFFFVAIPALILFCMVVFLVIPFTTVYRKGFTNEYSLKWK